MKDFRGGVALVTGAASGIGQGLAHALANAGMKVAVADLDLPGCERVAATLRAGGAAAQPVWLDVRDPAQWSSVVERLERELGPLQVLCSNAGVAGSKLPIEATSWDAWRWTMDVNLDGTYHALRTCLPRMRAHALPSHVLCTASLGAVLVVPGNGVYSATKAAIIALCEAVAQETAGSHIGVSVLCPGLVRTALLDNREKLKPGAFEIGTFDAGVVAGMEAGLDPMAVGEQVVAWMREGRFWMFTHPELASHVRHRADSILAALSAAASGAGRTSAR